MKELRVIKIIVAILIVTLSGGLCVLSSVSDLAFESIIHHGPSNINYGDYAKPANEQFIYHAIAGTIAANISRLFG